MKTFSLDLGCGSTLRNPYNATEVLGIDIAKQDDWRVKQADLVIEHIPFVDESFDYVTAYDFLEHIPRILYKCDRRMHPFVDLMSEIYRVLKPGGLFLSSTPCIPYSAAFQDPTHVNFITPDTFAEYFDNEKTWAKMYGFVGAFEIVSLEMNPPHLVAVLKKV